MISKARSYKLNTWLSLWDSLNHLIFPESCLACEHELSTEEKDLCTFCLSDLHFTHFETYQEPTDLDKLFWGRIQLQATYSLIYFKKDSSSQHILHNLKYAHKPGIGVRFGRMIGQRLLSHPNFSDVDLIVPVPLHPKKEFIRGYNQSEMLARGIQEITGWTTNTDTAQKTDHTSSQTRKGRFLRWDNVDGHFIQKNNLSSTIKHLVIVDDVITTGATIESLVRSIQKNNPDLRISIISLALAQ